MPLAVVVDTNFLLVPAQFGIDIFEEAERVLERRIEMIVIPAVVREVTRGLREAPSTTVKRHFRIAQGLLSRCTLITHEPPGSTTDEQVLNLARSTGGVLATNDRALRVRARHHGVPVLYMRSRKHLALDGDVV